MTGIALPSEHAIAPPAAAPHLPEMHARALDWPCLEAPSMLRAWRVLARLAVEPNPFFEDWYLLPALRSLDPGETVQMVLFEADGALAGLMPVALRLRHRRWPASLMASWTHPVGFLGTPLVAPGYERPFWRALFAWADRQPGKGLYLSLRGIPLEGRLHAALSDVLAEQRRTHGLVHCVERPVLRSRATPQDYFAMAVSAERRRSLNRHLARLQGMGEVRFSRSDDSEGLDEWIGHFLALRRCPNPGLLRQTLESAGRHGRLERRALTLDGKPIAMLANFLAPPGLVSFRAAVDTAFAGFAPGTLLQCENLALLDRADIAWADSCAGPLRDSIWRERRPVGRMSVAIGGRLRRAAFAQVLRGDQEQTMTRLRGKWPSAAVEQVAEAA